jgi:hypothetical protein
VGKVKEQKPLSRHEREKALLVPKTEYPQEMPCINCGYRWMQHKGLLCPIRPGFMMPLEVGDHIEYFPVEPVFGNSTFLPDVAYYKTPDFDVQ